MVDIHTESEKIEYKIKTMLRESNQQGWTTKKQVEDLIIKMSGKHYHYIHIYRVFFASGVLDKKYQKKGTHMNTATPGEEKNDFKKRPQMLCCMIILNRFLLTS